MRPMIACVGAGRMGRGIAVVFAYFGHEVRLIDLKAREPAAFARLAAEAEADIRGTLSMLARLGVLPETAPSRILDRVRVVSETEAAPALGDADIVFEGVPETIAAKHEALARASRLAGPQAIIASTTSTILVDALAGSVDHPERFLNAHWLNPPYLIPLVELSPGARTEAKVTERLKQILEGIGKVPVICAARPGYIVPRIQALAMNEAARMVEEGVANPEDIDKAVKYRFRLRFHVLGV